MKNSIKIVVLWLFVILISVSLFVYFGDTTGSFTPGTQTLGTVNGYPIVNKRISDFSDQLRTLYSIYEAQGVNVSEYAEVLSSEAFRRSVINLLVREEAKKSKISVSDADVVESIRKDYFKNDTEEFESFIKTGEATVQRDLEELIRGQLQKNYYEDVLVGIGFSPKQLEERIKIASKQRRGLVAIIDINNEVNNNIDKATLEKYFQENIARYTSASNRSFEDAIEDVRSDYLLENNDSLIEGAMTAISLQFRNFRSNRVDINGFRAVALANNMSVFESGYFNFFSRNILEKSSKSQPLITEATAIRKMFFVPVHSVSEMINRDNIIAVVYIQEEIVDEEVSEFVRRSYIRDLQTEVSGQLFNAYYTHLYNGSEVVVNQNPQGQ